jgi:hypothetical protein
MGFIRKGGAFQLLNAMMTGKCAGKCRSVWLRNIQYALKAKSNPLKLTAAEKQRMTAKVREVKAHRGTRKGTRKTSRKGTRKNHRD